ncbi:MAG: ATP-binding protein [Candidatus Omnitrophota bacterium]
MPKKIKKIISIILCFCFLFNQAGFAQAAGFELNLSGFFSGLSLQPAQDKFRPLHLRYLSYDNNADTFKLLLDKGSRQGLSPQGTVPEEELKIETKKLFDYFLIGLALPNESFWVNLRPDSTQGIIDREVEKTDIGRIFLEADVQLKKDTAGFTSPNTPEGKKYWDALYKKAEELFGYENITIPTLTRPWIVPGEIIIRENSDNAYIYKATLKVMLEQDYLASSKAPIANGADYSFKDPRLKALNEYASELIRELIIPKLTREINTSKKYASLRQVYYSLILAQWFKAKFNSGSGKYENLINRKNLSGLTSQIFWDKQFYFQQYQDSFNKGEYNLKENRSTPFGQTIRTYMSGGLTLGNEISSAIQAQTIASKRSSSPLANKTFNQAAEIDANGNIRIAEGSVSAQEENIAILHALINQGPKAFLSGEKGDENRDRVIGIAEKFDFYVEELLDEEDEEDFFEYVLGLEKLLKLNPRVHQEPSEMFVHLDNLSHNLGHINNLFNIAIISFNKVDEVELRTGQMNMYLAEYQAIRKLLSWDGLNKINPEAVSDLFTDTIRYVVGSRALFKEIGDILNSNRDMIREKEEGLYSLIDGYLERARLVDSECTHNLGILKRLKEEIYEPGKKEPINIGVSVYEAIEPYLHNGHRVKFITDFRDQGMMVQANALRLSYTWTNLIGNAIDAVNKFKRTPEGRGVDGILTVSVRPVHTENTDIMEVSFQDNGGGISKAMSENDRLFLRGESDKQGGTGRGLALCKEAAEFHGGTISVEPRRVSEFDDRPEKTEDPKRGARFVIRLPVVASSPVAISEIAQKDSDKITREDKAAMLNHARQMDFYVQRIEEENDSQNLKAYATALAILEKEGVKPAEGVYAGKQIDFNIVSHDIGHMIIEMTVLLGILELVPVENDPAGYKKRALELWAKIQAWQAILDWEKTLGIAPGILSRMTEEIGSDLDSVGNFYNEVKDYFNRHVDSEIVADYSAAVDLRRGEREIIDFLLSELKNNISDPSRAAAIDEKFIINKLVWSYEKLKSANLNFQLRLRAENLQTYGNPLRVYSIFKNLITNAVDEAAGLATGSKFVKTPSGKFTEVRLTDEQKRTVEENKTIIIANKNIKEGDKDYAEFSIENIAYITPEMNAELYGGRKLFAKGQTGKESGTGLGLALIEEIVKEHGGSVDYYIKDIPGDDTLKKIQFVVKLPAVSSSPVSGDKVILSTAGTTISLSSGDQARIVSEFRRLANQITTEFSEEDFRESMGLIVGTHENGAYRITRLVPITEFEKGSSYDFLLPGKAQVIRIIENELRSGEQILGDYHNHSYERLRSFQKPGPSSEDAMGGGYLNIIGYENKIANNRLNIVLEPELDLDKITMDELANFDPSNSRVILYPYISPNRGLERRIIELDKIYLDALTKEVNSGATSSPMKLGDLKKLALGAMMAFYLSCLSFHNVNAQVNDTPAIDYYFTVSSQLQDSINNLVKKEFYDIVSLSPDQIKQLLTAKDLTEFKSVAESMLEKKGLSLPYYAPEDIADLVSSSKTGDSDIQRLIRIKGGLNYLSQHHPWVFRFVMFNAQRIIFDFTYNKSGGYENERKIYYGVLLDNYAIEEIAAFLAHEAAHSFLELMGMPVGGAAGESVAIYLGDLILKNANIRLGADKFILNLSSEAANRGHWGPWQDAYYEETYNKAGIELRDHLRHLEFITKLPATLLDIIIFGSKDQWEIYPEYRRLGLDALGEILESVESQPVETKEFFGVLFANYFDELWNAGDGLYRELIRAYLLKNTNYIPAAKQRLILDEVGNAQVDASSPVKAAGFLKTTALLSMLFFLPVFVQQSFSQSARAPTNVEMTIYMSRVKDLSEAKDLGSLLKIIKDDKAHALFKMQAMDAVQRMPMVMNKASDLMRALGAIEDIYNDPQTSNLINGNTVSWLEQIMKKYEIIWWGGKDTLFAPIDVYKGTAELIQQIAADHPDFIKPGSLAEFISRQRQPQLLYKPWPHYPVYQNPQFIAGVQKYNADTREYYSISMAVYDLLNLAGVGLSDTTISQATDYIMQQRQAFGQRVFFDKETTAIFIVTEGEESQKDVDLLRGIALDAGVLEENIHIFRGMKDKRKLATLISESTGPLTIATNMEGNEASWRMDPEGNQLSYAEFAKWLEARSILTNVNIILDGCLSTNLTEGMINLLYDPYDPASKAAAIRRGLPTVVSTSDDNHPSYADQQGQSFFYSELSLMPRVPGKPLLGRQILDTEIAGYKRMFVLENPRVSVFLPLEGREELDHIFGGKTKWGKVWFFPIGQAEPKTDTLKPDGLLALGPKETVTSSPLKAGGFFKTAALVSMLVLLPALGQPLFGQQAELLSTDAQGRAEFKNNVSLTLASLGGAVDITAAAEADRPRTYNYNPQTGMLEITYAIPGYVNVSKPNDVVTITARKIVPQFALITDESGSQDKEAMTEQGRQFARVLQFIQNRYPGMRNIRISTVTDPNPQVSSYSGAADAQDYFNQPVFQSDPLLGATHFVEAVRNTIKSFNNSAPGIILAASSDFEQDPLARGSDPVKPEDLRAPFYEMAGELEELNTHLFIATQNADSQKNIRILTDEYLKKCEAEGKAPYIHYQVVGAENMSAAFTSFIAESDFPEQIPLPTQNKDIKIDFLSSGPGGQDASGAVNPQQGSLAGSIKINGSTLVLKDLFKGLGDVDSAQVVFSYEPLIVPLPLTHTPQDIYLVKDYSGSVRDIKWNAFLKDLLIKLKERGDRIIGGTFFGPEVISVAGFDGVLSAVESPRGGYTHGWAALKKIFQQMDDMPDNATLYFISDGVFNDRDFTDGEKERVKEKFLQKLKDKNIRFVWIAPEKASPGVTKFLSNAVNNGKAADNLRASLSPYATLLTFAVATNPDRGVVFYKNEDTISGLAEATGLYSRKVIDVPEKFPIRQVQILFQDEGKEKRIVVDMQDTEEKPGSSSPITELSGQLPEEEAAQLEIPFVYPQNAPTVILPLKLNGADKKELMEYKGTLEILKAKLSNYLEHPEYLKDKGKLESVLPIAKEAISEFLGKVAAADKLRPVYDTFARADFDAPINTDFGDQFNGFVAYVQMGINQLDSQGSISSRLILSLITTLTQTIEFLENAILIFEKLTGPSKSEFKTKLSNGGSGSPSVLILDLNDLLSSVGSEISSPVKTEATNDKGGIDFRALPVVTQPVLGTVLSQGEKRPQMGTLLPWTENRPSLDQELQQIRKMIDSGIVPSSERIKEYAQTCGSQDIDKILSCIADILRLEEERVEETDPQLRQLVMVLESDKPANEMQLAVAAISFSAKDPVLVKP